LEELAEKEKRKKGEGGLPVHRLWSHFVASQLYLLKWSISESSGILHVG
jgi:hypothetical protein